MTEERITLCLPSRGRPKRFARAIGSAMRLAKGDVEVVAWVDDDDPNLEEYRVQASDQVKILHGPREVQSNLWNRCWAEATGSIAMLAADDMTLTTPGWDRLVARVFEKYPDRIALAYGDDGSPWKEPTFPFVSREWIDAAGYFTPPHFRSWFADRWLWEIAYLLDRKVFLPRLKIQHNHPALGTGPSDPLYDEAKGFRDEDHPKDVYFSPAMFDERVETAKVLNRLIRDRVPVPA